MEINQVKKTGKWLSQTQIEKTDPIELYVNEQTHSKTGRKHSLAVQPRAE